MFICFKRQGKVLGVFQKQQIVAAIFNSESQRTTVFCEIAGKEEVFYITSTSSTDFAEFIKKLRK